jgi:hypothetical protein
MTVTINGSTGIAGVDGSAGTPAVQGVDTNTGMFFPAADTIAFAEGGAEAMRIDSSGNVGIGTSSPTQKLHVVSSGDRTLKVTSATDTPAVFTSSGSANAYLQLSGSADVYLGSVAGAFTVTTGGTEKARIDASGNLLVGTTSYAAGQNAIKLNGTSSNFSRNTTSAISHIYFENPNGTVGQIQTSGSSTSYITSSDYRLKENVQPLASGIETISSIRPVSYKWKVDGSTGHGFIAHELQAIVPDAVSGEKDAVDEDGKPIHQGVDYSKIVVHLVAAIQELKAQNDELKARVEALEAK